MIADKGVGPAARTSLVVWGYIEGVDSERKLLSMEQRRELFDALMASDLNLQSQIDRYVLHAYLYYVKRILCIPVNLSGVAGFNLQVYERVARGVHWTKPRAPRFKNHVMRVRIAASRAIEEGVIRPEGDPSTYPRRLTNLFVDFLETRFPGWRCFTYYKVAAAFDLFMKERGTPLLLRDSSRLLGVSPSCISVNRCRLGHPIRKKRRA
ncbi:MAG: hypothetical protein Kow0069_34050 [Promethearchaeota archaeon]